MSDWDHFKSLDVIFNTIVNLITFLCIIAIITMPLAVWKIIDLIVYLVY